MVMPVFQGKQYRRNLPANQVGTVCQNILGYLDERVGRANSVGCLDVARGFHAELYLRSRDGVGAPMDGLSHVFTACVCRVLKAVGDGLWSEDRTSDKRRKKRARRCAFLDVSHRKNMYHSNRVIYVSIHFPFFPTGVSENDILRE